MGLFDFIGSAFTKENDFQAQAQMLQDAERKRYAQQILKAQGAGDDTAYRNNLMQTMSGAGPSVADATQAKYANDAAQQAQAYANSARGDINPALLQRNAMKAGMNAQAQGAQNAGIMKNQEALNAQQLFSQNRAQNLGMEQFYQQLGMQGDLANQQGANAAQGLNAGISQGNADSVNKTTGGFIGGAGSILAASDENLKKNIKPAGKEVQSFLDALEAHKYSYKDPAKDGEGEYVSPMAQDLEKTPMGDSMVIDTPRGKMVDYGRGFGAVLAAQAELNKRLKSLEKKNG